jgi:hypothetical protein
VKVEVHLEYYVQRGLSEHLAQLSSAQNLEVSPAVGEEELVVAS